MEQVEQVEPESAVVYGGGLAWREFAVHAKLYGKVVRIRSDARCCRTLAVPFQWYSRCTPAMSVSSVTVSGAKVTAGGKMGPVYIYRHPLLLR